jgi:hypothetical protein
MPNGQLQDSPRTYRAGRVTPHFRHHLIRFRRFSSGSLALASFNRACRDLRPGVSATLTTIALYDSSLQWLGIDP